MNFQTKWSCQKQFLFEHCFFFIQPAHCSTLANVARGPDLATELYSYPQIKTKLLINESQFYFIDTNANSFLFPTTLLRFSLWGISDISLFVYFKGPPADTLPGLQQTQSTDLSPYLPRLVCRDML